MASERNYLSEFEQEWSSDSESVDTLKDEGEFEAYDEGEFEIDEEFENVTDEEFEQESDEEFEMDDELESEDEFEITADDNEFEFESAFELEVNNEVDGRITDRLYSAITGSNESELSFEHKLNNVLYEAEKQYFWKPLSSAIKRGTSALKKSGVLGRLKQLANRTPIGDVLKQYTALARGDIKGMLKGLAGQALSAAVPGGSVAKQLLNLEAPIVNGSPKNNARMINQVAKASYSNLIKQMGALQPEQLGQMKNLGKTAYNQAWKTVGSGNSATVRRITLRRGQKLVVKVI